MSFQHHTLRWAILQVTFLYSPPEEPSPRSVIEPVKTLYCCWLIYQAITSVSSNKIVEECLNVVFS